MGRNKRNLNWKLIIFVIGVMVVLVVPHTPVMAADNTTTSTVTSTSTNTSTATSTSTNTSTGTNTSTSTVDHKNQPPPSAKAPSISVVNSDVCTSGVSGGIQTGVIGISAGATINDKNCERIKLARELRNGGMKVASVAILCQDPRVFQAMIMSGTPCPAKGMIGKEAAKFWNTYPELRPDYEEYLRQKKILFDAGYIDEDGNLIPKEKEVEVIEVENEYTEEEVEEAEEFLEEEAIRHTIEFEIPIVESHYSNGSRLPASSGLDL